MNTETPIQKAKMEKRFLKLDIAVYKNLPTSFYSMRHRIFLRIKKYLK